VVAEFLDKTAAALRTRGVSEESLAEVADGLRDLAAELVLSPTEFPPAGPSQELVYEVGEDTGGIALYLISDAPGITSLPHEHLTWAVLAGIRGIEVNTLYRIVDPQRREVQACGEVAVGAGQTLVVPQDVIHSTAVLGSAATYHLHLYGKPLRLLPPFG